MVKYKVVEANIVTDEALETIINETCAQGWHFRITSYNVCYTKLLRVILAQRAWGEDIIRFGSQRRMAKDPWGRSLQDTVMTEPSKCKYKKTIGVSSVIEWFDSYNFV